MRKLLCAVLACLFMSMGFVNLASAADPTRDIVTGGGGGPVDNGWTGK